MDTPPFDENIRNGLAQLGAKQRELEAYAYQLEQQRMQLEQERAQFAMQQQVPQMPMVNPYAAMQQMPLMQPTAVQPMPAEPQPAAPQQPPPQVEPSDGALSSSTTTEMPKSDAQFLAAAIDQQATQFNAALEQVVTTMNEFGQRLTLLEGGKPSSPTFDEVFDHPEPTTPAAAEPVIEPTPPAKVTDGEDRVERLAQRVEVLADRVERLADVVERLAVNQEKTNLLLEEVVGLLRKQAEPDDDDEAVVLEMPTQVRVGTGVVVKPPAATKTKKKKHKRKKKKR